MPPNDHPTRNHLVALGAAAVLAVYGAGFVRTQTAAERFEGEKRRRRPVTPVPVLKNSADVSVPQSTASMVTERVAPSAKQAATVKAEQKPDTTRALSVAEKRAVETPAPAVADTTATKGPVDSAMVARDLKDGVYTGWGTSRHGDIEARVEIKNGRIISASISQCLTMYSVYWIAALPPQVVKRQSPEVDFVTGATESTNAFYYGVIEALKKAK